MSRDLSGVGLNELFDRKQGENVATIERRIKYRCSDDCAQGGCPWHEGRLIYQSTSDAYQFDMNGRTLYFERGELDAMIELLRSLGRVDAVQVPANV